MTRPHLFSLLLALLILASGCKDEVCDPTLDVRFSTASQFFTVKYLNNLGENYLNIWDKSGVVVYRNYYSNESKRTLAQYIDPGYANGVFGPFSYTDRLIDPATGRAKADELVGKTVSYNYFIRKDTYGTDTITVSMSLRYDGCNLVWNHLAYYLNGDELGQYAGNQKPEIVIQQ